MRSLPDVPCKAGLVVVRQEGSISENIRGPVLQELHMIVSDQCSAILSLCCNLIAIHNLSELLDGARIILWYNLVTRVVCLPTYLPR